MALKWMGEREGALCNTREICDALQTPFDTMARVLQVMNGQNILQSVRGVKGGYILTRPLREISFMELFNLIEPSSDSFCLKEQGLCHLHSCCNIIGPIERLHGQVNHFLANLNLEQLLLSPGKEK